MKILVLGGGDSPEREVSLRSARSVADAAREAGFETIEADPKTDLTILDEISKDTLVFPILHGKNGEDGILQELLEKKGQAFLGTDSQASAQCFDKWLTRKKLISAGLPMPRAVKVNAQTYKTQEIAKEPHVIKVLCGGSSIGTLLVKDPEAASQKQIDSLFELDSEAVLEELIEGTEATISILDQSALPVIEIVPPQDEEFDYENKYNGRTKEICPPESIAGHIQEKVKRLAEKTHAVMNCRHLSRVDVMIDRVGNPFILEINTIPGLTNQSLYPKSAAAAGYSMPQLVAKFAELVRRDYGL
jgi:D-alanine-D-alanine ligase